VSLRTLLFAAIDEISNIIDVAGDGKVLISQEVYKRHLNGIKVEMVTRGVGGQVLKWSDVENVLVGLRQYVLLSQRWESVGFQVIVDGVEGLSGMGFLEWEGRPVDVA